MKPLTRRTTLFAIGSIAACALPGVGALAASAPLPQNHTRLMLRAGNGAGWRFLNIEEALIVFDRAAKIVAAESLENGYWTDRIGDLMGIAIHGAFAAATGPIIRVDDLMRAATLDAISQQVKFSATGGHVAELAQPYLETLPGYVHAVSTGMRPSDPIYVHHGYIQMTLPSLVKHAEALV